MAATQSRSTSQNNQDLLTAAMSAVYEIKLESPTNSMVGMILPTEPFEKVSLFEHQRINYYDCLYGKVGSSTSENIKEKKVHIDIFVKTLTGKTITFEYIDQETLVYDLKTMIMQSEGIPLSDQSLIFASNKLEDNKKLVDYNMQNKSTILLLLKLRGGGYNLTQYILDPSSQDPQYDYDFTNVTDENKTFKRGGMNYVRPCGWMRFAIKVSDKYENLTWLGNSNIPGEWAVSYHGTGKNQAKSIAMDGYDLTKGKRFAFGVGVYSTPDIKVAEKYAIKFSHKNKQYAVILQNRVNPATVIKIPANRTDVGEYWISPSVEDIRPYGICIRKL
ncbi:uncharacterized protein LOC101237461 [Hydra vulgaris]|uniref:uncharacterized protein LOC101237461 n=1 Tax=Hydra vulgaris TaxID=6087 RepID=UPI0002B4C817|nr:uncharacterized protein LOC101237461 [Hydra vulgaris]